jgi:hypothetical protein
MVEIIYSKLLKKFDEVLISTSRGFDTEYEFLESWVPDQSINQSIIDLISSAIDYSVDHLKIEFSAEEIKELDENLIKNRHKVSGIIELNKNILSFKKNS